jgi:molybdopterin molybdotransferase
VSSAALSFREARAVVIRELGAETRTLATELVDLESADGRVLAENIYADRDYPTLDRTARDGFAVRSADMPGRVRVIGEVRAGERFTGHVGPGEAVEIMTGAPIPAGAGAIVMVENVTRDGDFVSYEGGAPVGQFINQRGGESAAGSLLLSVGTRLGFAEIGLLASVGCAKPSVFTRPHVAIIATGDELVAPDETPEPHQIRNSNAYSLAAQVRRVGGVPRILDVARDDEAQTRELIESGLQSDMLLLSGGVSAGKYDVVELALKSLGTTFFFDRVAIQPGQPLVFGRARDRLFFGLPGNPASTMVTFEFFARTALEVLAGQAAREPIFLEATLTKDYRHKPGLTRFLPASISPDGLLTPVPWTGSSDIAALTRANAWMMVDADRAEWKAGERMRALLK